MKMKTNCCGNFRYRVGMKTCWPIPSVKRLIADLQGGQLAERRRTGLKTKLRSKPAGELHLKGVDL